MAIYAVETHNEDNKNIDVLLINTTIHENFFALFLHSFTFRPWKIVNGIFVMDISSGFRSFINAISLLAGVVEWNK